MLYIGGLEGNLDVDFDTWDKAEMWGVYDCDLIDSGLSEYFDEPIRLCEGRREE